MAMFPFLIGKVLTGVYEVKTKNSIYYLIFPFLIGKVLTVQTGQASDSLLQLLKEGLFPFLIGKVLTWRCIPDAS